jgi:hypothetical protein
MNVFRPGRAAWACFAVLGLYLPAQNAVAQVIPNGSFESGLSGWTVGGTGRVAVISAANVTPGPFSAADGTFFAILSSGPGNAGGGAVRIDGNTTNEFDVASLAITVDIPFRPAVLAFEWSFGSSEQDQPGQYDDLFDLMIYQGTPPADPTTVGRVFSGSSPRNGGGSSISNFPDTHILTSSVVNWSITGAAAGPVAGTQLRFGIPGWRHACVPIPLPETAPPFTRTIRFRVADQGDAMVDSALVLDRVEIRAACDATPLSRVTQITHTSAQQVAQQGGGFVWRGDQQVRAAVDPSGTVRAVASNANLDGTNPNLVQQVFVRVGLGGWSRVTALPMALDGEIQGLAFSGTLGTVPGRYLAIAARVSPGDNTEIYRWDRQTNTLTTITATAGCHNRNPAINRGGDVIAFDSDCTALGVPAGHRHVLVWAGGGVNAVSNVVTVAPGPTAACTARNPWLNHHADTGGRDGRYLVYEANCNHGANADGNYEIFRFNRNTNARTQITASTAPVTNFSPQIDRDDNGRNVYFLSNGNYAGGNPTGAVQLFRFECNNNADCTGAGAGFVQWTQLSAASHLLYGFRIPFDPNPAGNTPVTRFAFERIDLSSGITQVGYQAGTSSAAEQILALQNGVLALAAGMDATVPVVQFITAGDLINQNADLNPEAYSVRVE